MKTQYNKYIEQGMKYMVISGDGEDITKSNIPLLTEAYKLETQGDLIH